MRSVPAFREAGFSGATTSWSHTGITNVSVRRPTVDRKVVVTNAGRPAKFKIVSDRARFKGKLT